MFDFHNEERDVTALPLKKAYPVRDNAPDIFEDLLDLLREQDKAVAA